MSYPPNEVLQHSEGAPTGDGFDGAYYSWTDRLPRELRLPDSDLLKALHTYASDYYGHAEGATHSLLSMDGTALIASAILLEELVAESLEKSGNLVFCEAKGEDNWALPKFWNGMRWVDRHLPVYTPQGSRRKETRESNEPQQSESEKSQAETSQVEPSQAGTSQAETPGLAGMTEPGGVNHANMVRKTESEGNLEADTVDGRAAQHVLHGMQQRRYLVQHLVTNLQRSDTGGLSNELQAILAEGRSNILSAEDRRMVELRIRDIEARMEEKRREFS